MKSLKKEIYKLLPIIYDLCIVRLYPYLGASYEIDLQGEIKKNDTILVVKGFFNEF